MKTTRAVSMVFSMVILQDVRFLFACAMKPAKCTLLHITVYNMAYFLIYLLNISLECIHGVNLMF